MFIPTVHHVTASPIASFWKGDIHSAGCICNGVILVKDQLGGFAFKLCSETSSFKRGSCIVMR